MADCRRWRPAASGKRGVMLDRLRQGLSLALRHFELESQGVKPTTRRWKGAAAGKPVSHLWSRACVPGCPDEGTFDGQVRCRRGLAPKQQTATKRRLAQ